MYKKITAFFVSVLMLCAFFAGVSATGEKSEPLPAEPDTTLGDVQKHFSPEAYSEMPEEMKKEVNEAYMDDLMRISASAEKIFGGIAIVVIAFLTVACIGVKPDKNGESRDKKQNKKKKVR